MGVIEIKKISESFAPVRVSRTGTTVDEFVFLNNIYKAFDAEGWAWHFSASVRAS